MDLMVQLTKENVPVGMVRVTLPAPNVTDAGTPVLMTEAEAKAYNWGNGPLPARFGEKAKKMANGRLVTNAYEAYWAAQPVPVQRLAYVNTEKERIDIAKELESQGFAIDVPIMIWGRDPLAEMLSRRSNGREATIMWAKGFENTSPWLRGTNVELF